jgi:hypothetical protein
MVFGNELKNIQAVAYNDARTVLIHVKVSLVVSKSII